MSDERVLLILKTESEVNRIGDHRRFKIIMVHLGSVSATVNFLINVLNYKKWFANKIAYNVDYRAKYYQRCKALKSGAGVN